MEANFSKNILKKTSPAIKISYTLKPGDYKRISKKGILKVYHLNEPIEIPVIQILGKWKETHQGITISKLDKEWQVEGDHVRSEKKPSFVTKVKRGLSKYILYLYSKGLSIEG